MANTPYYTKAEIDSFDLAGKDALEVWQEQNPGGTYEQWQASLKGADGYTPVKGVDYFDGEDGADGEVIFAGESGVMYDSLALAQAVDPKPANGTVFQVSKLDTVNAGVYTFQSGETGGVRFEREYLDKEIYFTKTVTEEVPLEFESSVPSKGTVSLDGTTLTGVGSNFYCAVTVDEIDTFIIGNHQWLCIGKSGDGKDIIVSTSTNTIGGVRFISTTGALETGATLFPTTAIPSEATRIKIDVSSEFIIISYSIDEVNYTEWGSLSKNEIPGNTYSLKKLGALNISLPVTVYSKKINTTSMPGYSIDSSGVTETSAFSENDRIPVFNNDRQFGVTLINPSLLGHWTIGKTAVVFGDSITSEHAQTTGVYTERIKNKLGLSTITRKGYSGFSIGTHVNGTLASTTVLDSIVALAPDVLIMMAGTNDFGNGDGCVIGTADSTVQTETIGGMRFIIRHFQKYLPNACFVFCTPTPRTNQLTANVNGNILVNYVDALKQVCGDYSVPVVDLFRVSGIGFQDTESSTAYLSDGLHLTEAGYERITSIQANQIKLLR